MVSQDESAFHISWPGIVALLVAALGLIVSRPSLDSPRPTPAATDGKLIPPGQGVPARLWQDPLTAAQRGPQPKDGISAVVKHRPTPSKGEATVLFLFDCIDPENTPEAAETRRRERYAVLCALNTAGYVPTHPDRIYSTNFPARSSRRFRLPLAAKDRLLMRSRRTSGSSPTSGQSCNRMNGATTRSTLPTRRYAYSGSAHVPTPSGNSTASPA